MEHIIQWFTGVDGEGDFCLLFHTVDTEKIEHVRYLNEDEIVARMEAYDAIVEIAREVLPYLAPDPQERVKAWSSCGHLQLRARLVEALEAVEKTEKEVVCAYR